MTLALNGIGVSQGIAIGKARILQRDELDIPEYTIPPHLIQAEIARYQFSLEIAIQQLRAIRDHIPPDTPADIASFIDAHLLMLDDPTLSEGAINHILDINCNAEKALKIQRDTLVKVFDEMDDPYLRTRKDDIDHVVNRIQRILQNQNHDQHVLDGRIRGQVIITDDLSPADTILLQHNHVAAIISEQGGPTSHTAILSRSLGIPALVGVDQVRKYIKNNDKIIVDGQAGIVIADADSRILQHYIKLQKQIKKFHSGLQEITHEPAVSIDGIKINLHANIELPEEMHAVKKYGAAGIGLFRTEFLFLNRTQFPTEDEQYETYVKVIEALHGKPLTIRTLDLGADKQVIGDHFDTNLSNSSPLGLRAIRLCLKEPSMFLVQLRAILRASSIGKIRLMIPMLSNLQELHQVTALLDEAKCDLDRLQLKYDPQIEIGCMIETPAAALVAKSLAKRLDFLSIGTNDLIQYTLAIDRIDSAVSYLYDPLNPAVLILIQNIIRAGNEAHIPVSMCGELASDSRYTRLLLGMGLKEFSMLPSTILGVKQIVRTSNVSELKKSVEKLFDYESSEEINVFLEELNQMRFS